MKYEKDRACGHFHHYGFGVDFAGREAVDHYPRELGLYSAHIRMAIKVEIIKKTVLAKITHHIVSRVDGETQVVFDGVELESLKVYGPLESQEPFDSHYDGKKITVKWHKPFAKGESRQVTLDYRVESPKTGLFFMHPTDAEPDRPLYAATDHETERARYWLAAIDFPNMRSTLDWHITAPQGLTVLANGAFCSEDSHEDGTKTVHWSLKQPCPTYLACFAVGDFTEARHGRVGGVEIASFATRQFTSHHLDLSFSKTGKMLTWMIDKLKVPYPYPKYYQFALPNFGGAMENISLVSWSDHLICTESSFAEQSWLMDQVNIHEMAHSYFGDLIGCKDYAHVWLKESWATYMETCWLEDQKGEDEMRYDLWRNAAAYFAEADEKYQRPLVTRRYNSSWQLFDSHLYPGGAARLHTLRHEVGDQNFWAGVREYLSTFQNQVVETDDFRKVMEKNAGRTLQKFFDQWIYAPGYPDLKVVFSYDKEHKRGLFEVEQKQAAKEKSSDQKGLFELKAEIGWTEVVGQKVIHRTESILISRERQTFVVGMDTDPLQVRFDPLGKILHKLEFDPGEMRLKEQLTGAPDVVGRILAAQVLAKSGKPSHLSKILEAYKLEKFWGVRREMLKAIADANTQKSIEILLEVLNLEKDPMVLDRLYSCLGRFRDPDVEQALLKALERNDLPPKARVEVLNGLAFQCQGQSRPDLLEAFKMEWQKDNTPQKIAAKTALYALGRSGDVSALDYLMEKAGQKGGDFRTRKGAVQGLGGLLPFLERPEAKRVEQILKDLLRDEDSWVRENVVLAMAQGKLTGAISDLQHYASKLPLQDRIGVDRVLAGLTAEASKSHAFLEKTIEELKTVVRKLESRIQDLEDGKTVKERL